MAVLQFDTSKLSPIAEVIWGLSIFQWAIVCRVIVVKSSGGRTDMCWTWQLSSPLWMSADEGYLYTADGGV